MKERIKKRIQIITGIVLIIFIVTGLLIAAHFRGYERTVNVNKDAYVYEYYPDKNYGVNDYIRVGNYQFGKVQAYYHFNISSLPDGWREANIIVRFDYGSDFVNVGANLTYESWDEMTITWNNKPNKSVYRGWISCDGFDFRIPIRSDHIINDGVGVCLYGRGGVHDGYIQGNSKEGASSKSDIAWIELSYIGIDPIILTGLTITGIVIYIVIAAILVIVAIFFIKPKFSKNSKNHRKSIKKNPFGANWLNANINKFNIGKAKALKVEALEKKVNQYITLKLEYGRTFIYVDGKKFIQCIRLILNIPKDDVPLYDEVDSIDEAAKLYSTHIHQNRIIGGRMGVRGPNQSHNITSEQEFWGHCSNIQAWVEHDYDTRILMSNISFPLLRELTKAGDPKASKVYKEEIALRLESGYPSVVQYLLTQGYIQVFSPSEFKTILESTNLIKNLSSEPKMLFQFLRSCVSKFPTLLEDILLQILKFPDCKNIFYSSIQMQPRISPFRPYLRYNKPQFLLTLKTALESLFLRVDEKTGEDILDCIYTIDKNLERPDINYESGKILLESIGARFLNNQPVENINNAGAEALLQLKQKILEEFRRSQSKCKYCGKMLPRGKKVCDWCGHKKDDDEGGFFPYPFIFKPPGGGGGGRLKEVAIAIPVRI